MQDINQTIQGLMQMKQQGKNPQAIMQMLMQRNPRYQQMLTQLKNMANGRNPQEFIMQLAKQNGVNEQNMQSLQNMFTNQ